MINVAVLGDSLLVLVLALFTLAWLIHTLTGVAREVEEYRRTLDEEERGEEA